jgi:hypothetical protein
MCKEIWVEAVEALESRLDREPTDAEIDDEYRARCSALIEKERDKE